MKAITFTQYGPPNVLQLQEVAKPAPKDNEILVRVHATTVGVGDIWARNFKRFTPRTFSMPGILWLPTRLYFGISKPRVNMLGGEFAGEVEAVGKDVSNFSAGDQVFGYRGQNMGANAEYLATPADGTVALKPSNMSYEEAAGVPYGAITALNLLRKANIQSGQKVLVNGASGNIGSAAVQLLKNHFGAEVTGVCSTAKVDYVKSLGADKVIDYTQADFAQSGETYDLILDVMNKSSFAHVKNSLSENGIYMLASFKTKQLLQMLWTSIVGSKKVVCALASDNAEDLNFIKELVEAGKFKAFVDKRFPMEQAAEAHAYVEAGHKKGTVALTV
ncbi:MAG: NAD(P)-dependent alcohol dehydrogenase [Chloroflexi bacterium]|nr:MAG: NAD(P)-dependent alcohol dehydrogenase [Chloroflexota bacterium]MBL1195338.1 NAD(P)-dependent alcohol dehydrogenase [Chloroflexota bacterium]NOH12622.1 NAD(P)-dependent alcohol dehydrogenase [Chloroflexota bacterium]